VTPDELCERSHLKSRSCAITLKSPMRTSSFGQQRSSATRADRPSEAIGLRSYFFIIWRKWLDVCDKQLKIYFSKGCKLKKRGKKRKLKTSSTKSIPETPQLVSRMDYKIKLQEFDSALCEAIAVSQAQTGRYADLNVGYGTRVFSKMCSHGTAMIRASPLSRWISSESENWDFSCVAGHARAILEGCLLFNSLMRKPDSEDELKVRINILHLNDCTRRIELMRDIGAANEILGLEEQQRELQTRLRENRYFQSLPNSTKTRCLQGKNLTVETRDQGLAEIGFSKGEFDSIFDLLSQHTHILPLSFYRMEINGRGTGLENNSDRSYIAFSLGICSELLISATDKIVAQFPDIADVRMGVDSKFSPGPASNRPIPLKPNTDQKSKTKNLTRAENTISQAIGLGWPKSLSLPIDNSILSSTDAIGLRYPRRD
jgi:hypothetical protein